MMSTLTIPFQMSTLPSQSNAIILSQISSQLLSQQTSPVFPAPLNGYLIFLHGNISACSGCHQRFSRKPNGEYADPHMTWLSNTWNQGCIYIGMPTSKIGNAYYHVYLPCLQYNWPTISANDIIISFELKTMLLYEHKNSSFTQLRNHLITIFTWTYFV